MKQLKNALLQHKVTNVDLIEPMKRTDLLSYYNTADVLFLHLNNLPSLKNVIPSKLFEYAATEKPILGGLSGYSAKFATDNIKNMSIFPPCDVEAAIAALERLSIETTDRRDFVKRYSRKYIVENMAAELLNHAQNT